MCRIPRGPCRPWLASMDGKKAFLDVIINKELMVAKAAQLDQKACDAALANCEVIRKLRK